MGQRESSPFAGVLDQLDRDNESGGEGGLSQLNLEGVRIDEATARVFADYMRRRDMSRLKHINLGGCGLTFAAFHHLVEAICSRTPGLIRLDMSTTTVPPQGNSLGTKSTNSIGMLLRKCYHLTHLRLGNCNLDCNTVIVIADVLINNQFLKTLDLSYNHVSDTGAERLGYALQHNRTLEGLQLWKNHITSEGAEGLSAGLVINSHLQWLGLGCNNIGDDGVCSLAESLTTNIEGSALVWLGLGSNRVGDRGAQALADLLSSGITSIDEDEGEEGTACTLTTLGLGGNEITDEGAVQLAQALDRNEVLISIGLSHNRIGDEGAQAIADMLRNNGTLEKLSLSANDITDEGGEQLIAALTQNVSLTTLLLAQNPIGDTVCDRCAEVFTRYNFTVQVLDLNNTRISSKAFRKYVISLKNSETKLKALGGSLPRDSLDKNVKLPSSGNVLEIASWRPPASSALMRRKLFDGVQITERANALLSLPTSALTPRAIGRRNSMIIDRQKMISTGFRPGGNKQLLDLPDDDIQEGEEGEGEYVPPPLPTSESPLGVQHLGLSSHYQLPGHSPSVHSFRKKLGAKSDTRSNGLELRQLAGGKVTRDDAVEEYDSQEESEVFETRETWFTDTQRHSEGREAETQFVDGESDGSDNSGPVSVRVRFSQEEMRWVEEEGEGEEREEEREEEPTSRQTDTYRVRFNQDVEVLQKPAPVDDNDQQRRDSSWLSNVSESDWTTVDMMEIPANVNLLDKKKKRGSVVPSFHRDSESEDESEVEVIDSEREEEEEGESEGERERGMYHLVTNGVEDTTTVNGEDKRDSVSLDVIQRRSLLSSPTRDRARPTGRRRPSISPSSSLGSIGQSDLERSGGLRNNPRTEKERMDEVREEEEDDEDDLLPLPFNTDEPQILSETPAKEEWIDALKKRIEAIPSSSNSLHTPLTRLATMAENFNYVITSAKFPCNMPKTRPNAPLPPNRTRIKLQMAEEELGSDYINASYLGSPVYDKSYIITQWPLQNTVPDFWRLIWEYRVGVVVVLGSLEGETQFWPKLKEDNTYTTVSGDKWSENSLYVNTWKTNRINDNTLQEHSIQVHSYDEHVTDTIALVHYPHWPVNGIPDSLDSIVNVFHWSIAARQKMTVSSPLLVVSPLGGPIGAAFVSLSVAYELIHTLDPTPFDNDVNILDSVFKGLLELRPGLIPTLELFESTHVVLDKILSVDGSSAQQQAASEGIDAAVVNTDSTGYSQQTDTSSSGKKSKNKKGLFGGFGRKNNNANTTSATQGQVQAKSKKSKKQKFKVAVKDDIHEDRNALIF